MQLLIYIVHKFQELDDAKKRYSWVAVSNGYQWVGGREWLMRAQVMTVVDGISFGNPSVL